MHYFSHSFLERAADFLASGRGSYHVAKKSIPSKDGPVQVSEKSMSQSSLCHLLSGHSSCIEWSMNLLHCILHMYDQVLSSTGLKAQSGRG